MPNEFVAKNGIIAQNNSVVSGSLIVTNGITGSLFGTSSQAVSASFTATSSFGLNAISASYAFTASSASTAFSASFAQTSSFANNFTVANTLTAQTLVVSTISSSVVYSSGSNIFGNSTTNVQQFTGSLRVTGSGFHWILGGRLGIGVVDPSYTVDTQGDVRIGNQLLFSSSATGVWSAPILFRSGTWIGISDFAGVQLGGYDGVAYGPRFTVMGSGNTGIGIINPTALLHISGSGSGSLMRISSAVSSSIFFVSGSGNIGIGTIIPTDHLSIEGSGDQALSIYSNTTGVQGTARTFIKLFGTNTSTTKTEQVRIASAPGAAASTAGQLIVSINNSSNSLTERLRIDENGNVGIGNSSPSALLHISGSGSGSLMQISSHVSSSIMFVSGSGNVGFGLTQPRGRVHATGSGTGIIGDASDNFFGDYSTGDYIDIGHLGAVGSVFLDTRGTSTNVNLGYRTKGTGNHIWTYGGGISEAMRINGVGSVGIGTTSLTGMSLRVSKNITGATTGYGIHQDGVVQSDVTAIAHGFTNRLQTQATAFTLPQYNHFYAVQVALGAGSVVTTQAGFFADSSLTSATNNYGFYGNIPSGSNRYNLYMAGTAINYLANGIGIGIVPNYFFDVSTTNNAGIKDIASFAVTGNGATGRGVGIILGAGGSANSVQVARLVGLQESTSATANNAGFAIQVANSSGVLTEYVRVNNSGNLGINTTTPSTSLDVSGSGRFTNGVNATGSVNISGSTLITGSLGVTGPITGSSILSTGTITAQTLVVTTISSSVVFSSGSNIFGNSTANTQTMTGSLNVSGSATIIGRVTATDLTGSLFGTASWATNFITGSVTSASYAFTASSATNSTNALTASSVTPLVQNVRITGSLLVSSSNQTQLLVGSSSFFISSSGNIGINTTIPRQKLHIVGSTGLPASSGTTQTGTLRLQVAGYGTVLDFGAEGPTTGKQWLQTTDATNLGIYYPLLLNPRGGNVGVGFISPSATLHISGSGSGSLFQISSHLSSSLFFVSGSGNVGIGTITPEFKLDVSGSGQARIGAAELGNWPSVTNYAFFGHERLDQTAAGNYALLQDSGGSTYVNASTGRFIALRINNITTATVESTRFTFTGSFGLSGSMLVTGSITGSLSGSVTGSLFGTASQAISASFARFAFSASFAPGFSVSMSQLTPATTWSFVHNLNSRNPIVQVYNTSFAQIIPNEIVGMDNSTAEIRFDYAQAGYAVASNGGGLYVTGSTSLLNQTSPAVTWSFTHNLNSKYVAFEIYDSNDNVIIPSNIKVLGENSAEIHLSTAITGKAVAQFSGINGSPNATTASYALTASFVPNLIQNVFITGSLRTTGSVSITGSFSQTNGYMVLSQVSQSLNYADDTAAAAAGVPLGGIYRSGNFILIRLS